MADGDSPVIVVDAGANEWRCGWSDESGPSIILPGLTPSDGGRRQLTAKLRAMFEALQVEDASECTVLVGEPAGVSDGWRCGIATVLFAEFRVKAVAAVATPLLCLYSLQIDSGCIVDVGERVTCILPVHHGCPLLTPTAVLLALGGSHVLGGRGADGDCDGLFDPSALDTPSAEVGVADAVAQTIALCDQSVHCELLANVYLVGGGTMLPGFPERMRQRLHALATAAHAPRCGGPPAVIWASSTERRSPRAVANGARRIMAWLGGASFCALSASRGAFVSRACYEAEGPSCLGGRERVACATSVLPCASLAAAQQWCEAERARAIAAHAKHHHQQQRAAALASLQAARWWIASAPAGSPHERARQQHTQQLVVHALVERAVVAPQTLPPAAALALALDALHLLAATSRAADGDDGLDASANEARMCRQLRQSRHAAWTVRAPIYSERAQHERVVAHRRAQALMRGWRKWLAWRRKVRHDERVASSQLLRARRLMWRGWRGWLAAWSDERWWTPLNVRRVRPVGSEYLGSTAAVGPFGLRLDGAEDPFDRLPTLPGSQEAKSPQAGQTEEPRTAAEARAQSKADAERAQASAEKAKLVTDAELFVARVEAKAEAEVEATRREVALREEHARELRRRAGVLAEQHAQAMRDKDEAFTEQLRRVQHEAREAQMTAVVADRRTRAAAR